MITEVGKGSTVYFLSLNHWQTYVTVDYISTIKLPMTLHGLRTPVDPDFIL